jgi:hypothetical protein
MQQARADIMPGRDSGDTRARFVALRHDRQLVFNAPTATPLTPGDDLDGAVTHSP